MARVFETLDVWKNAVDLAVQIYKMTKTFPDDELYGITSQVRHVIISVSSNIAEGSGKGSKLDYIRYLKIALGSLNEVESLIIVSNRLDYIEDNDLKEINKMIETERKLLFGFIKHLEKQV